MVLQLLSACADELLAKVVLPAVSCCVPLGRDHEDDDEFYPDGEKDERAFGSQLDLTSPPRLEPQEERPGSLSSLSFPQWMARSQIFSSRTTSWSTVPGKPRAKSTGSGWPTISGPSDFKKIDGFGERPAGFRPLQLSIYLPSNRLSPLPDFSSPRDEAPELAYPAPSYAASRTMSVVSQTSSEYRIRRKPVGSGVGLPAALSGRESFDLGISPSTAASEWVAQPLRPRPCPSEPLGPGAGDALSAAVSQAPKLRARASTEPTRAIRRRDGESCLRVKMSSEESELGEANFRSIDTIPEERRSAHVEEEVDISAIIASDPPAELQQVSTDVGRGLTATQGLSAPRQKRSSTMSDLSSLRHRPLPPTPLTFIQPNPFDQPPPPPPPPKSAPLISNSSSPSLAALQRSFFHKPSLSRVTRWLLTSSSDLTQKSAAQEEPVFISYQEKEIAVRATAMSPTLSTVSFEETMDDSHVLSSMTALSSPERSPSRARMSADSRPPHVRHSSDLTSWSAACPAYEETEPHQPQRLAKPQVGLAF